MKYFVVFQNQTYHEEKKGQYLWAPQKTQNNKSLFYWESMKNVNPGDIIFSMFKQHLYSVNVATERAIDAQNPFDKNTTVWGKLGWLVKAQYNELEHPVSMKEYRNEILELSPPKYSPFTKNGGGTQGYLFEISDEFGEYFMNLVKKRNEIVIQPIHSEKAIIESIDQSISNVPNVTEKDRVVKARIGQGIFKQKLLKRSFKCEICGLDIPSLLIASHCKPWSKARNEERLDPNNGLLLCINHDGVFDRGLIGFDEDGTILISRSIHKGNYELLNLNKDIKIDISEGQMQYINWHKENKFSI